MSQLNGRMRAIEIEETSLGAVRIFVPLRPLGVGIEWEIIWAIAKQNDGAVLHGWEWFDPENPEGVELYGVTGVLNVPLPLGAMDSDLPNVSMGSWWATDRRYPCYRFDASAVDKVGKIIAIVIEHIGTEGLD